MWKTLGGFSAEISRFQHILPHSTAQINCSGSDLLFFRKPYEDAMIAAIAKVHHLTVVTRNVADFSRFEVPLLNPFTAGEALR